jgi:hypothetical protein|tara:strand:+ start:2993 stop:3787 length:795 start_codon:yes stop_codon:yes gene_type:complete
MKIREEQSNEVAIKKEAGAIANVNIEQFADEGFDNVDSKSLALPFLKVLGQLSPQVTMGDSNFIEEARPGMIYNTVTDQLYDGSKGIRVIPCYYKLEYIEWRDRGQEGSSAPINVYPSDSDIMSKTTRGDDGKDRLENGNYIEETASHYVMIVEEDKTSTALITMKSTQRKKSKKWNSMMMSLRQKKKDGKGFFKPAPFTQNYLMKTVLEKNNLGSWYGWEIEHIGTVESEETIKAAFEFYGTCKKGAVKVNHGKEESVEKTPF